MGKLKMRKKLFKKQKGNDTVLTACILVVIGIMICAVILGQIQSTGRLTSDRLNDKIASTQKANTWIK